MTVVFVVFPSQQISKFSATKIPKRIGVVQIWDRLDTVVEGLKLEMEGLGYKEGKDVIYEEESWDQDPANIEGIVRRFVESNVDSLIAVSYPSTRVALDYTAKTGKLIPIVYALVDHPDRAGIIKDFRSSGNNATGIASNMDEVVPLQLHLLKRMKPDMKRLGLFTDGFKIPQGPGDFVLRALYEYAPEFGITIVEYKTEIPPGPELEKEWRRIADRITPGEIDAIYHIPGHFILYQDVDETKLGQRLKIPNVMPILEEVGSSEGLFSYGADSIEVGRQAAAMVDKIWRGASPSDIPSESPRKNIFELNVRIAQKIGLDIPESILAAADRKVK